MYHITKLQNEAILNHGLCLQRHFGNGSAGGPVALCKALQRWEVKIHRLAEDICSGAEDTDKAAQIADRAVKKIASLLPTLPKDAIVINFDPYGYALKIDDDYMRAANIDTLHRDWGGYGILAPDLSN